MIDLRIFALGWKYLMTEKEKQLGWGNFFKEEHYNGPQANVGGNDKLVYWDHLYSIVETETVV